MTGAEGTEGMVPLAAVQAERRRKQEARHEIARILSALQLHGLMVDANGNIIRFNGGNGHGK